MRWLVLFFSSILILSSCNQKQHRGFRVGIDASFAPLNFEELQPYVNGYVVDLLLEISRFSGMKFEKVHANWDDLLEGMSQGRYDVIISSMPPYNFNLAKYEFSQNFLDLGPVLVVPSNANYSDLANLSGELVGVINGDPAVLVIETYPEVIIRGFDTIPELLNAVANGSIEAAVLDRLPALNYVRDLYIGRLKIATAPLTPVGLHTVALKGEAGKFTQLFDQALNQMKKKKALEDLQKKWHL